MFIVVKLLTDTLPISIINTIIEVIIGGTIYVIVLMILKYEFLKDLINQLLSGLKMKKGRDM